MCERLKQAVLKTAIPERVSGVRIPLPPPIVRLAFFRPARARALLRISPAGSRFATLGSQTRLAGAPGFAHARKAAQLENAIPERVSGVDSQGDPGSATSLYSINLDS